VHPAAPPAPAPHGLARLLAIPRARFVAALLACFLAVAAWAAVAPTDRKDWALENGLVLLAFLALAATARRLPLSRLSYFLIFLFLCLHEVGSHYTYSLVPYDGWVRALTGRTLSERLGTERNHYDRLVHFSYGLLLAYPVREVVLRVGGLRGFWGYFLPLDVTMSTSMIYELIEWGAAAGIGGDLGVAYLGSQGDPWDAQKDMALASLGAACAMAVTALVNWRWQRDFAREFVESLRVKLAAPRGEESLARRLADGRAEGP